MKRLSQILVLLLLIAAPLFVLGLHQQWWSGPRHWNPFMPLHVTDPVTPVTGWKRSRLEGRPQACLDALNTAPEDALDHLPLEDYTPVESCPLTNVVRVRRTGVTFNNSFVARCPLALAWVMLSFSPSRVPFTGTSFTGLPVRREVVPWVSFCTRIAGSRPGEESFGVNV